MSTPQIYDIGSDTMRSVTQEDVDQLQSAGACVGLIRMILRKLSEPAAPGQPAVSPKVWHAQLKLVLDALQGTKQQ